METPHSGWGYFRRGASRGLEMGRDRCKATLGTLSKRRMVGDMVPMLSTFLDFTVNSITHATGCSAGITIACAGMGLGGALAAISGFRLLRDWRAAWVSVTGQLTSCSVEVFPPLFLSRRKFVQITYVYRYAAGGQTHEGSQTVVERQEVYFDPRKRAREIMAQSEIEIFHDELQPSRSRLRKAGRPRAKLNISLGPGGARSRLFSRLRFFTGAKVALVTGLGIAASPRRRSSWACLPRGLPAGFNFQAPRPGPTPRARWARMSPEHPARTLPAGFLAVRWRSRFPHHRWQADGVEGDTTPNAAAIRVEPPSGTARQDFIVA